MRDCQLQQVVKLLKARLWQVSALEMFIGAECLKMLCRKQLSPERETQSQDFLPQPLCLVAQNSVKGFAVVLGD